MKRSVKIAGTLTLGLALLAAGGCSEQTTGPTTADFQKQRAQGVEEQKQKGALYTIFLPLYDVISKIKF